MNRGDHEHRVLLTTVPPEAKGGIAALHEVLLRVHASTPFRLVPFPVASPEPFKDSFARRLARVLRSGIRMAAVLGTDPSIRIVHINTSCDRKALLRDSILVFLARGFRRHVVLQVHSAMDAYRLPKPVEWIARKAFARCDRVLVFSERDRKVAGEWSREGRTEIFPNAVDVDAYGRGDGSFRTALSIPAEGNVVLFLSRMIREKGGFDLIEAIPGILREFRDACFVFAGEGPEKGRMEEACRALGVGSAVRFPGYLPPGEVARAFDSADLFVLPSYAEGMPMAILQALAAGLPIVSTPVGAIPETLRDGVNGFFVEPHSSGPLAEKILLLLRQDGLRKEIGSANRRLAREMFSAEVVSDRLDRLYSSVISGPGTPSEAASLSFRRKAIRILRENVAILFTISGIPAVLRRFALKERVTVAVYHDPEPGVLKRHLEYLSARYRFLPMDRLIDAIETGDWSGIPTRSLVVTLDDGHRGNHALLPLFREYGVVPTIYLCSDLVGTNRSFWWKAGIGDPRPWKRISQEEMEAGLSRVAGYSPQREYPSRQALSLDEVREMSRHAVLGSHSRFHVILTRCGSERCREEIVGSKKLLETILSQPIGHFSYPSGDYREREIEGVKRAGYRSARTLDVGWNGRGADPFRLKAVAIDDDASLCVLGAQVTGFFGFLKTLRSRQRRGRRCVSPW